MTRLACFLALGSTLFAQSAIQNHIDAAKKAAGDIWAPAAAYFCGESPAPNNPSDPAIEPTRIFDNVAVIGSVGTAVYVISTSDGLILIDAGYPDQVESVVLAGLKRLGLDPAKVRYVIVTHGHTDHFGAAKYFQETHGAKVFLSAADWDLLNPAQGKGKGPAIAAPKRDQIVEEGKSIVLGDTQVMPFLVPGHTQGALALTFPVMDRGTRHIAGLFGGSVLVPGFVSTTALEQYIKSVSHYAEIAAQNKVDVELQNHPLMDGFAAKLAKLATRGAADPNPFVVGQENYAAFLRVMSECGAAQLARRTN